MRRIGILPLLLASCSAPPAAPTPSVSPAPGPSTPAALSVRADLDPLAPDPVEGDLGLFVFRLANNSKDRVVLLKEMIAPEGGAAVTWSAAPKRPLRYDSARDEFLPAADTKAIGAEPLNVGLLLPGEAIQFRPRIRLLGFPRRYVVRYFQYGADEAAQLVYFEERREGRVRYRRVTGKDVAEMVPSRQPEGTHRSVVFPHGDSILETPRTLEVSLDVPAAPRSFRLSHALQKAAVAEADVVESTYSMRFGGWAFRTRTAAWLVTQRAVSPLPPIARFELFFQHLDLTETGDAMQVDFFGGSDGRFPDTRIVLLREGGRARRIGFVGRDDIPAFLQRVHQEGFEIDVHPEPGRLIVSVRRRSWQLGDALAKVGLKRPEAVEVHYSTWLGGWAVRSATDSWFVGPDGADRLPVITRFGIFFASLDALDPGEAARLEFAGGTESLFLPAPPASSAGIAVASLAKDAFRNFLRSAREKGVTIEVRLEDDRVVSRVRR